MAPKTVKAAVLGKTTKKNLSGEVFAEPFNESLVHEAVRADLNARRQGTQSTLTRGEVSMTGAKAWRQKGTGRARVGALGVPHRRGGGVAFAPKPRHYIVKVNRKARRRALRSALSVHAARESIAVLEVGDYKEPSTKTAAKALTDWGQKQPTLLVPGPDELSVIRSFRNIPRVVVLTPEAVGVSDLIGAASLVVTPAGLEALTERAGAPVGRGSAESSDQAPAEEAKAEPKKAKAEPKKAKPAAKAVPAEADEAVTDEDSKPDDGGDEEA